MIYRLIDQITSASNILNICNIY